VVIVQFEVASAGLNLHFPPHSLEKRLHADHFPVIAFRLFRQSGKR
jgi:hypothetical protein